MPRRTTDQAPAAPARKKRKISRDAAPTTTTTTTTTTTKAAATTSARAGVETVPKDAAGDIELELAPPTPWSGFKHGAEGLAGLTKITTWNVNGLRALCKKEAPFAFLKKENPDLLCLQETKCTESDKGTEKIKAALKDYKCYWHNGTKKGYSGTMLCSKREPISVVYGMGEQMACGDETVIEHGGAAVTDTEGRVITAEFDHFYVVTVYTPNSGQELVRLEYRGAWDKAFGVYCRGLAKRKKVIVCGDLNVAHRNIDLARPKQNHNKSAGFTDQECGSFTTFLAPPHASAGQAKGTASSETEGEAFVDIFRRIYPEVADTYTYWGYRFNAKAKNLGWRIDYMLVSPELVPYVCDQTIRATVSGSDHCPVTLHLALDF